MVNLEKKDRRFLCGIAFVFFGILLFLKELGILSADGIILDPKSFPIYLALIFLYGKETKIAAVLGAVGLLLWFPTIAEYIHGFANLIWPVMLIGIGAFLIVNVNKKGLKEKTDDDQAEIVEAEEISNKDE